MSKHGLKMKYFVLKPRGDGPYAAASRAMIAYASVISEVNPKFARELREWALKEQNRDCT